MAGRHTGLPPPLPFAHPADLVRAHQKDEQCRGGDFVVKLQLSHAWQHSMACRHLPVGELRRLVLDAVDETLGRRAAAWQSTAGAFGELRAAYTA